MGESKVRAAGKAAVYDMHITRMEQIRLAAFVMGTVKPKNDRERKRFVRAIEEFGWEALFDEAEEKGTMNLTTLIGEVKDESAEDQKKRAEEIVVVTLTGDTVEFVLEQINVESTALAARVIHRLEERLKAVKNGDYKLPEKLTGLPVEAVLDTPKVSEA